MANRIRRILSHPAVRAAYFGVLLAATALYSTAERLAAQPAPAGPLGRWSWLAVTCVSACCCYPGHDSRPAHVSY
jgi:hypothetical protein